MSSSSTITARSRDGLQVAVRRSGELSAKAGGGHAWVYERTRALESNTICRYLATLRGRFVLLPAEEVPRAYVEQWMDWQAMERNDGWVFRGAR